MTYDYLTINFFPVSGLIFLFFFLWRKSFLSKNIKNCFYILSALVIIELATYNLELYLSTIHGYTTILTAATAVGYTLRPFLTYVLIIIIGRDDKKRVRKLLLSIPALMNFLFAFSAFFTHYGYYYDENNQFHRGPIGWTPFVVMTFYLIMMIAMSYSKSNVHKRFERVIIIGICALQVIGTACEILLHNPSTLRCAMVASLIFYYTFFQSEIYQGEIVEKHIEQVRMSERLMQQMIETLAGTVDAKDSYTKGHSQRVADYSREIARRMNKSEQYQRDIYYMGLLHDIGKIGIPDMIINKSGKLTDEEFAIIKSHPAIGSDVLKNVTEMPNLYVGARWHHERYDGRGYPDGLYGDKIPFEARIIAVADAYDAMTSNRSYRHVLPQWVVREELEKAKRTQLDPYVVNIMLEMIDEDTEYRMHEK